MRWSMRSVLNDDDRRFMPCTTYPFASRNSARWAPSWPVTPVMRATFPDDPAMISPDRASTHTRPHLLSNTIERRRHALAEVKSVDRTDRAHRLASAERREGANEYN